MEGNWKQPQMLSPLIKPKIAMNVWQVKHCVIDVYSLILDGYAQFENIKFVIHFAAHEKKRIH